MKLSKNQLIKIRKRFKELMLIIDFLENEIDRYKYVIVELRDELDNYEQYMEVSNSLKYF